jgi:hypothetical protein
MKGITPTQKTNSMSFFNQEIAPLHQNLGEAGSEGFGDLSPEIKTNWLWCQSRVSRISFPKNEAKSVICFAEDWYFPDIGEADTED